MLELPKHRKLKKATFLASFVQTAGCPTLPVHAASESGLVLNPDPWAAEQNVSPVWYFPLIPLHTFSCFTLDTASSPGRSLATAYKTVFFSA